ncbi:hypothetical protein N7467_006434 [Penicillium canescens]|nr:hypothetical protein N7467_006434 [Penicillium canescens]
MGIVISNFSNYGFVFHAPSLDGKTTQWRIPLALQLIFPVVVMAAIPWCVESPRWLASKGRNDQVYEVLARLRGNGVTATSEEILQAGEIIISTAEHEAAFIEIMTSSLPMANWGIGDDSSLEQRLESCIRTSYPEHAEVAGWVASAFIFLFEFCFGIGWNSMCWLYGSEINSLRMRNKGAALQCMCNWATNFVSVMTTPVGFATIGWKYYLVWMSLTLASIPWLYFCYPETTRTLTFYQAGRSLEQMDLFFAKYQHWNIRKVAHEIIDFETPGGFDDEKDGASSHEIEQV